MPDQEWVLMWWSGDNGQLYLYKEEDKEHYEDCLAYEVRTQITFTPEQLTVQDGDILEALLRTNQARQVQP